MRVVTHWILLTKPGLLLAELKLTPEWKLISTCSWGGENFCVTACTCSGFSCIKEKEVLCYQLKIEDCCRHFQSKMLAKILKLLQNTFVYTLYVHHSDTFSLLDWHKIVISWGFTKPTWSTVYLYMNGKKLFCRPRYAWFHAKFIFSSWSTAHV